MSLAETLGVERAVILHVDDLGLCHGGNRAYLELAAQGFVTCGSVMVPCPWFREIAEAAAAHPSLDLGVHLTLTSEWATYRWAPISTEELASGWRTAIEDLAAGVTHVALHAATPGEIEAISPQYAPWRTNEYALFRSGAVAGWCAERGIAAIGYCEIPQLWRGRSANVGWV